MPFYMDAYIRDLMIRMQCQFVVYDITNLETYSVSGNESKVEGRNFVLKNEQKFNAPGTAILRKMEDYLQK